MEGEFAKTMLAVGVYHSPDGVIEITPERLKHWERQASAIQSVGWVIPSHFDHSNDEELLTPLSEDELRENKSRSARNTVGRLKSFRVNPDGQSAEIVLQTLDPQATQSVASNAVYVSPVIHPKWPDGKGNTFQDALTSFDLVDWPVDHSQSSFTPLIRMGKRVCPSIRMGTSQPYLLERRGMSTATKARNRSHASRRARFKAALAVGIQTMSSDKPDDEEDKDKSADSTAMPDASETPTPSDDPSPTDTIGADSSEAPDLLDSVLNLLGEYGVTLPDDTTDANLIPHLRVALTALLNMQGDDEEGEDEASMETTDAMPQPVTPTIATMSVQQRKALDRAAVAERALSEQKKASTTDRLSSLLKSGRCTPHEHDSMLRTLGTVRMSMTDEGSFKPNRVDHFIEDRETVPEGAYWSDTQKTEAIKQKLSVVEPPDAIVTGGGRSHSEFAEAVRALGGNPDA